MRVLGFGHYLLASRRAEGNSLYGHVHPLAVDCHSGMGNRAVEIAFAVTQPLFIIIGQEDLGIPPTTFNPECSTAAATSYHGFDVATFVASERFVARHHILQALRFPMEPAGSVSQRPRLRLASFVAKSEVL